MPDHDRLTGNVTVEFALESFAGGRGPGAGVARVALAQLAKDHRDAHASRSRASHWQSSSLIAATGARGPGLHSSARRSRRTSARTSPAIDPGVPAPAPPPPSAPATMTVEEAKAEARSTGSSVRGAYQGITDAPGAAGQIPGYQAEYPGLTQYYDNPGNMYADGAAAGYQQRCRCRTANSTTRPTVDVTRADLSRANTVTDDPDAYLQGVSADGSTGNCVPLPPSPGTTNTAEWTCNVGSAVVEQPKTCTRSLTVAAWNETLYPVPLRHSPGISGLRGA